MVESVINLRMVSFQPPAQELHSRARDLVGTYLTSNLRIFGGLAKEAESTILPVLSSWIDDAFQEVPECRAPEDHGLVIWANLPTCGVMSVYRYEWCITSISNMLAKFKRNGIAILVHPNRGQVSERSLVDSTGWIYGSWGCYPNYMKWYWMIISRTWKWTIGIGYQSNSNHLLF